MSNSMHKWKLRWLRTIQTFMDGRESEKERRNHANTRGVVCLQMNHNRDEYVRINEGHNGIYNVALPKI